MTTASKTDRSVGLGLVFSIAAVAGAIATGILGYQSALGHDGGGGDAQLLSGVAFGAAVLLGAVAIVATHVYAE